SFISFSSRHFSEIRLISTPARGFPSASTTRPLTWVVGETSNMNISCAQPHSRSDNSLSQLLESLIYFYKLLQRLQRGARRPTLRIILCQLLVEAPKAFFQAELGKVREVSKIHTVEVSLCAPKAHGFIRGLSPGRRDGNLSKRIG